MRELDIRRMGPDLYLHDDVVKGLQVRSHHGKSFHFYYKFDGRQRKKKIGDWPLFSLAKARNIAKDLVFKVANGIDPLAERQAARTAPTVADMCKRYWDEHASSMKSAYGIEIVLRLYIEPKLGRERVADLDYDMIYEWHRSIGGVSSNRALSYLSSMCTFSERWGWRPPGSNPCRLVKRVPEKSRRRYITDGEAVRIEAELEKLEATMPQSVAFLYLLIYTGARCGEIAKAKWSDMDGDVLSLPDSKSGYPRTIHLPEQAMRALNKLPRSRSSTITGIKDPKRCWIVVRTAAGCPDLRMHDLRHNFASDAVTAGLSLAQIGELLGHKNASTTMRYAHLMKEVGRANAKTVGLESERRRKRRRKG